MCIYIYQSSHSFWPGNLTHGHGLHSCITMKTLGNLLNEKKKTTFSTILIGKWVLADGSWVLVSTAKQPQNMHARLRKALYINVTSCTALSFIIPKLKSSLGTDLMYFSPYSNRSNLSRFGNLNRKQSIKPKSKSTNIQANFNHEITEDKSAFPPIHLHTPPLTSTRT